MTGTSVDGRASELIFYLMMRRLIAPNLIQNPDRSGTEYHSKPSGRFECYLVNSFGFGGTNSAIVMKKL